MYSYSKKYVVYKPKKVKAPGYDLMTKNSIANI